MNIVYGKNGPQNDDGNYLGPCSKHFPVAAGKLCHLAIGVLDEGLSSLWWSVIR